ncbi:hypothetical protein BC936DRAFT_146947 [Jimgerdemannia flammicorona]|uniref:Uncharacterized protein n=1 Tax=Jimgerdemannia flammicorona TaxID=994334 RepID=A0A433D6G2_9FUNG|nr:hypothetical protein BC936DRAFT_146947 [Jimgerdemannia flammicorona]
MFTSTSTFLLPSGLAIGVSKFDETTRPPSLSTTSPTHNDKVHPDHHHPAGPPTSVPRHHSGPWKGRLHNVQYFFRQSATDVIQKWDNLKKPLEMTEEHPDRLRQDRREQGGGHRVDRHGGRVGIAADFTEQ